LFEQWDGEERKLLEMLRSGVGDEPSEIRWVKASVP